MKNELYFIVVFMLISFNGFTQTLDKIVCFLPKEEMARFSGCEDLETINIKHDCSNQKLLSYVYSKLKYPKECCFGGMIVVSFTVTKTGKIKDVKIMKSKMAYCGKIIADVFKNMPDWIPSTLNGVNVDQTINFPIRIKCQ